MIFLSLLRQRVMAILGSMSFFAVLAFVVVPVREAVPDERPFLGFALIASQSADELHNLWQPVLEMLGKHLGTSVQPDFDLDYAGLVWGMRTGRSQVGWFGNKSAIEAVDNAGAEVFAQVVQVDGTSGYHSFLIVRSDSRLRGVDDVLAAASRLEFGLGDANSTSGFLVPGYFLFARNGLDPRQRFKRVTQASHEQNFLAVLGGRVDVATISSSAMARLAAQYPDQAARITVIWRSPLIPSNPLVWRRDLPEELKERIRAFFLDYGTALPGKPEEELLRERDVLARIGIQRFVPSDDRQLLPIRQIELFRERQAVVADSSLTEDERGRRLVQIDARVGTIDRDFQPAAAK